MYTLITCSKKKKKKELKMLSIHSLFSYKQVFTSTAKCTVVTYIFLSVNPHIKHFFQGDDRYKMNTDSYHFTS